MDDLVEAEEQSVARRGELLARLVDPPEDGVAALHQRFRCRQCNGVGTGRVPQRRHGLQLVEVALEPLGDSGQRAGENLQMAAQIYGAVGEILEVAQRDAAEVLFGGVVSQVGERLLDPGERGVESSQIGVALGGERHRVERLCRGRRPGGDLGNGNEGRRGGEREAGRGRLLGGRRRVSEHDRNQHEGL